MGCPDDYKDYLTATAHLAAGTSTDDEQYATYHSNINQVLDQLDIYDED